MGDRCHNWQHWICGLFNTETDKKKEADYIFPKCRLTDIEDGKWVPQTLLRAKDLPRTNLSDHIEQRLFTRTKQEREEIAKSWGTELENVSEAVDLVVRVVVYVDKSLEQLEGVDACIFGMYVQEEENIKITAVRLTLDVEAFWSRNVEALSKKLDKSLNKRTLKTLEQENPTNDVLVMQQLGDKKQKVMTLNGVLDALVHASRCRNIDCSYQDCQTIMRLLRHASRCSVMYAGGCGPCKQAWWVLMKHVQIYMDLNCKILRCKEMKNHIEKNASSSKKKQNPTDKDE
nr:hypothetical protein [Tanacetum cinerariifolium]